MAITVTSTDPDAYYWLGRCYESQNRKMDAANNYRKAISLDKNFTEARQRIRDPRYWICSSFALRVHLFIQSVKINS